MNITIRTASPADAGRLLAIYAPYIIDTVITFEYDVPTEEQFRQRMAKVQQRYPWLVAEADGEIIGYAYASQFKDRAAYDWAVETSIYVEKGHRHAGVGRLLHDALEQALRRQGILNMNACLAYSEHEDEYLPTDSLHFHRSLGYEQVAHFHKCGRKCGRWYDMIWMEKLIGDHQNG